jgi:hypothetical protein
MPRRKHDRGTVISSAERRLRGGSHLGAAFDAPLHLLTMENSRCGITLLRKCGRMVAQRMVAANRVK